MLIIGKYMKIKFFKLEGSLFRAELSFCTEVVAFPSSGNRRRRSMLV